MKPECVTCGARDNLVVLQCSRCGSREEFCRTCVRSREDEVAWLWAGGEAIRPNHEYLLRHKECPKKRWIIKPKVRRIRWRV